MSPEISKNYDLGGRTALITGATGGIGGAIAKKLSSAGARTIIHTVSNLAGAKLLTEELENSFAVEANIATEAGVKSIYNGLKSADLIPDLLVNNAGVQTVSGLTDADEAIWQDINNVNLGSIFALTKYFANTLKQQKIPGAIVNIASIEGLDPAQDHSHYSASKAGVISFTKASALELGPSGIRVNAVSPGLIARPDIEKQWPEGVKRWKDRAPLQRLGAGDDIANAVHFLLSDGASWISGANLVVDGGMSSQNRW